MVQIYNYMRVLRRRSMLSETEKHFLKTKKKLDGTVPPPSYAEHLRWRIKQKLRILAEEIPLLEAAGYTIPILPMGKEPEPPKPAGTIRFGPDDEVL